MYGRSQKTLRNIIKRRPVEMDLIHTSRGQTSLATDNTSISASFLVPDVLELIIFLAIPNFDVRHVDSTQALRTAPTNASLVNKHWRSVALHSRRLWATIQLRTYSFAVLTRRLSQFSLFLERCGPNMDLPLDFGISCRTREFRENTYNNSWRADLSKADIAKGIRIVERYLDLLLPRRSGWRRVHFLIWARPSTEQSGHWPWRIDDMRALEEFNFFYPPGEEGVYQWPALFDFSSSERLQRAQICGHVHMHLREGIKLEHLRSLDLCLTGEPEQHPSDVSCYSFLERAPNLQSLTVTVTRCGPFVCLSEPVTLPHLEKLIVAGRDKDTYRPMLAFLSSTICPSLRELEIKANVLIFPTRIAPESAWSSAGLTSFLQRSACPLQILSIDSWFINHEDLSTTLRCIPTLRSFELRRTIFPTVHLKYFMDHLMYSDKETRRGDSEKLPCPDLETLMFRQCRFESGVCELVVAMIYARWRAEGSKLSYFDFSECNLDGFDESQVIKQYRSSSRFRVPALEDSTCTSKA